MKNNKKSFISIILIGVIVVLIGLGVYFAWSNKSIQLNQPTLIPTGWKTYSSVEYGFSFSYPSTWQVSEKTNENGKKYVDLSSGIYSDPQEPQVPSEEIQFSVVDKNYFNPPIGTKYGLIGFDFSNHLLIDTEQLSKQCLLAEPLLRVKNAPLGFQYDGSLMSNPAHFNYALLTQSGKIILVTEFSEGYENVDSEIALSFKLLNGDSVSKINCVSAPN